jgi:hypothetical protein
LLKTKFVNLLIILKFFQKNINSLTKALNGYLTLVNNDYIANFLHEGNLKIDIPKNLMLNIILNPKKRLKKLKTGNPNQLDILKLYKSKHYKKIEKFLHRKFSGQKTLSNNEFFYLSDEQVFDFLKYCDEAEYIIESLKDNPYFK